MRIFLTKHVKDRLQERKIPLTKIHRVITDPDHIKISFNNRMLIRKKFGTEIIEVVCIKKFDKILVITAYLV